MNADLDLYQQALTNLNTRISDAVGDLTHKLSNSDGRLDNMAKAFKGVLERLDKSETRRSNNVNKIDDATRALIRKTIAPSATEDEFSTFMYLCSEYNLDPLKKEIYFIKYGTKASMLTSRDGYLKIANADLSFDGLESDVVYIGDTITKRGDTSLHITYGENHLKYNKEYLSGAFCNIYRKDRRIPTTVLVSLKDYHKKNDMWNQYTNAMILKVAESMALKRAFALSGLVTKEEMHDDSEKE